MAWALPALQNDPRARESERKRIGGFNSRHLQFRLNLRYRDANGKVQICHTLNNTVIASPRILIAVLENNQQADGSVLVPKALRQYMNGMEQIAATSSAQSS